MRKKQIEANGLSLSPLKNPSLYTPLHLALAKQSGHAVVTKCICAWSDLLDFGSPFKRSNWAPTEADWKQIADRLRDVYCIHCRHPPDLEEFLLVLNDGVIRTKMLMDHPLFCGYLSLWFRAVVWSHIEINRLERHKGLPGVRTVVTAGERANYSFEEVRFDDTVLNYTRTRPGLSKVAEAAGNPLLVCNPAPLQMNTAFSKAFLLDEAGSGAGLRGNALYVDKSFLEFIRNENPSSKKTYKLVERERTSSLRFVVEYATCRKLKNSDRHNRSEDYRPWCMGFELDKSPGQVVLNILQTTVYRLRKFFPHDENPALFWFDLDEKE